MSRFDMRMVLTGVSIAALAACSSGGSTPTTTTFAPEYFSAAMTPGNVVPAASGSAAATTNLETASSVTTATVPNSIKYSVSGSNLSGVNGVFIYKGASGSTPGTPEVTLCTTACTSVAGSTAASITTGSFDSTKVTGATWGDFLTQLRTGAAYVQITTSGAPNGAVRGQFGTSSTPPDDPFFVLSRQY